MPQNDFTNRPPVQSTNNAAVPPPPTGQQLARTNDGPIFREIGRSQTNHLNPGGTTARRIQLPGQTNRAAISQTPVQAIMPVRTDFDLQLALDRLGFSPGNIDGLSGPQTRAALRAFQTQQGLAVNGQLDENTRQRLATRGAAWTTYVVTTNDLVSLQPLGGTWTEKSQQNRLGFESLLELVAEKHHCSERLLQRENPSVQWAQIPPGSTVRVPAVIKPQFQGRAALIRIRLAERILQVLDDTGRVLMHCPCSIAAQVGNRPLGELKISTIAPNPNYTFDPAKFPTSPEAQSGSGRLIINPGPNNPVGTVWIGLDRPGYGIHGTPSPDKIGRTESLGCFRLANWNANRLLSMVAIGTRVLVEP